VEEPKKKLTFTSIQEVPESEVEHIVADHMPIPLKNRVELLESGMTSFLDESGSVMVKLEDVE